MNGTSADQSTIHSMVDEACRSACGLSASFPAGSDSVASLGSIAVADYRSTAGCIDQVLSGGKAGDLPIHLPTRGALLSGLKALGMSEPLTALAQADKVTE